MKSYVVRKALVLSAAALILGVAACAAPADMDVDVGRRLRIEYDAAAGPAPEAILEVVRGFGPLDDVTVQVRKRGGAIAIELDAWGDGLPAGPLAGRLQEALPGLAGASIEEEPLTGKVRGTLGEKLGHDLLDLDVLDAEDVEEARQRLMAELRAQGVGGQVDVQIEDEGGGKRKVKVRVQAEAWDPETEAPAGQAPGQAPAAR